MLLVSFILFSHFFTLVSVLKNSDSSHRKVEDANQENEIFKSRIEILADVFRQRVDYFKENGKSEVELVFLIDASSSVGEDNFQNELKFVRKLVADFTLGPNATRVAVITFATEIVTYINHIGSEIELEKCSLLHFELPQIRYIGGNTFTLGALQEAESVLINSRKDAKKALFLITDGFSNNGDPVPVATELKRMGVKIFTFGVSNGNVDELYNMASPPADEYSYLLESFAEFEALARRALHEDLNPGLYTPLLDFSLCGMLCNNTGSCCNANSTCSCGTLSGHFSCLCPPGFYGSGLEGDSCQPCPKGTYNDGSYPGDISVCRSCPDQNQNTKNYPATTIDDCFCKDGFEPVGNQCEVVKCTPLSPPKNGYFVKENCSNVLNAACGVRCHIGYELSGSSVRICQLNGSWSGVIPSCLPKKCPALKPVRNGDVVCTHDEEGFEVFIHYGEKGEKMRQVIKRKGKVPEKMWGEVDENFLVDTVCRFNCPPGFSHVGSKLRNCLPVTRWDGLQATCKPITCSSLPKLSHGNIEPENCTIPGVKHKYGTACGVECLSGFHLKGNKIRLCTGKHGTWTGKSQTNKCVDIEPPKFTCSENITLSTDPGEAFATVNFTLPPATDNSGVKPILWTKPPISESEPVKLAIGSTHVQILGVDPSGNLQSCFFWFHILDEEPPQVLSCHSPGAMTLSDLLELDWQEPDFSDNSGNYTVEQSNETLLSNTTSSVEFKAVDGSGNIATCLVNVTIIESICSVPPSPRNANVSCTSNETSTVCFISCHDGYTAEVPHLVTVCEEQKWTPEFIAIPDCSEIVPPAKTIQSGQIVIEATEDICSKNPMMTDLENSIVALFDSPTEVMLECAEEEKEEATNEIWRNIVNRRKRQSVFSRRLNITIAGLYKGHQNISQSFPLVLPHQQEGRQVSITKYALVTFITFCNEGSTVIKGDCVKCAVGYYFDSAIKVCKPCSIGNYQNVEGSLQCVLCPSGTSTMNRRSRSISECRRICPIGTYGNKINSEGTSLAPCRPCSGIGQHKNCVQCSHSISSCGLKTDPCSSSPCQNNATCLSEPFLCLCTEGFIGTFCDKTFKPCDSSPCLNGAVCNDLSSTKFVCACSEGYEGQLCQQEVNFCAKNSCGGNGECTPVLKGYFCDCVPPYHGKTCSDLIDSCGLVQPCLNNGTCVNIAERHFKCECNPPYLGRYCGIYKGCIKGEESLCADSKISSGTQCNVTANCDVIENTSIGMAHNNGSVKLSFSQISLPQYLIADVKSHELSEISSCLWLLTADKFNFGTLFSYATLLYDNAFTLTDYNGFVLYVLGQRIVTDVSVNDNLWHFICVTWASSGGVWVIYVDGDVAASGSNLRRGFLIPGNGKMVIGQEQDFLGGGFNKAESYVGNMTQINVWKEVLTPNEIRDMAKSCTNADALGSLISWESFLKNIKGDILAFQFKFCRDCGKPSSLFRGRFTLMDEKEAIYTCEKGFQMKFTEERSVTNETQWARRCLKTGHWEPLTPICSRVSCGLPGSLLHGKVIGRSFLYEDVIEYKCHNRYRLIGQEKSICNHDGKWSGTRPSCQAVFLNAITTDVLEVTGRKCKELSAPRRGTMFFLSALNSFPGDQVEFVCDPGYYIYGANVLTCMQHGDWDYQEPICSMCPLPELSKEINWSHQGEFDLIKITCISTGEVSEISCSNGTWTIPDVFCGNRIRCPSPQPPKHGFLITKDRSVPNMFVGDTITFGCRHGYQLIGGNILLCSSDMAWNISDQSCQRVHCVRPTQPLLTYPLDTTEEYAYGDIVTYHCLPGYHSTLEMTSRCEADQQWSQVQSICKKISCGIPEVVMGSKLLGNSTGYMYGDSAPVVCPNGKFENIKCQSNGKWTIPSCF